MKFQLILSINGPRADVARWRPRNMGCHLPVWEKGSPSEYRYLANETPGEMADWRGAIEATYYGQVSKATLLDIVERYGLRFDAHTIGNYGFGWNGNMPAWLPDVALASPDAGYGPHGVILDARITPLPEPVRAPVEHTAEYEDRAWNRIAPILERIGR